MRFNPKVTLAILAITTLIGAAYMSFGVLDVGPAKPVTRVTLMLNNSGGLMPTSQVLMRGVRVGRVTGIKTAPDGLAVSIDLDDAYRVPANSAISVQNLSVAGEQYVDFSPKVVAPPYFTDGAVIPADRVASTVMVSELLAKANALFSALNPADVHTIVANIAGALAGNDDALDSLATSTGLAAKVVRDDKQLLATLFRNVSTLTNGLGDLNAGAVLSETTLQLQGTVPAFLRLIHELEKVTTLGDGILADDEAVGKLVAKLSEYIDTLSVPLSTFATVLQPVTAPLRGLKIDAGHWLDFWESTFNDTGGMRVQLNVPEWHTP